MSTETGQGTKASNGINTKESSRICISCQWCCKTVYIPIHPFEYPGLQFYVTRGIEIAWHNGHAYAILPQTCQHLTRKGCGIYSSRPDSCRLYDGRSDWFHPEACMLPR